MGCNVFEFLFMVLYMIEGSRTRVVCPSYSGSIIEQVSSTRKGKYQARSFVIEHCNGSTISGIMPGNFRLKAIGGSQLGTYISYQWYMVVGMITDIRLETIYRIAGLFRGRKFSRMAGICVFRE